MAAAASVKASSGRMVGVSATPQIETVAPPAVRRWKIVIPAIVVVASLIGGLFYWRSHRAPALSQRDTIVLADFVNKTGDPVFDDTLKQALAVDFGQSPFLNILPDRRMSATLRLMGRSPDQRSR
jgi:hypothetical protein